MAFDPTALNADLQALADKYQVHISGTATPVDPQNDPFDVTVQAVVASAPSADESAPEQA